ncbi:MAG: SH3 domain-containing protein [Saprospiraceae bacterium]|nr:SH3 domain-containing protein [Saprospiraceae bacterium]
MSEQKKTGLLRKLELGILVVFFLAFTYWAASRCSSTREELAQDTPASTEMDSIASLGEEVKTDTTTSEVAPVEQPRSSATRYTPLYVTIDGLNLRAAPNLESEVLTKLQLYEEVQFLNEVTEFETELSLGKETASEPWIKVKSKKGHSGWVFGAGVHYYKKKHEGAF